MGREGRGVKGGRGRKKRERVGKGKERGRKEDGGGREKEGNKGEGGVEGCFLKCGDCNQQGEGLVEENRGMGDNSVNGNMGGGEGVAERKVQTTKRI